MRAIMGKARPEHKTVRCICNGVKSSGIYEVADEGRFLVLTTPFGPQRVLLGISDPRRLASKLMKNVCMKATVEVAPACCAAATATDPAGIH